MNLLDYQKSGNAFGTNVTEYPKFGVLKDKIPRVPGITSLPYVGGYVFTPTFQYYESYYGTRYQLVTPHGIVSENIGASLIEKKYVLSPNAFEGLYQEGGYDPFRQSIGSLPFVIAAQPYQMLRNYQAPSTGYDIENILVDGESGYYVNTYNTNTFYRLSKNYENGFVKGIRFSSPYESPFLGKPVNAKKTEFVVDGKALKDDYIMNGLDPNALGVPTAGPLKVFDIKKYQLVQVYLTIPTMGSKLNEANSELYIGIGGFDDYQILLDRARLNFLSLFCTIPQKTDGYTYSTKAIQGVPGDTLTNVLTFKNNLSPYDFDRTAERYILFPGFLPFSFYETGMFKTTKAEKTQEISHIAFQILKRSDLDVRKRPGVFSDYSFDVESTISATKYEASFKGGAGQGEKKAVSVDIKVPSGVPVNSSVVDGSLAGDKYVLTANLTSNYNFLNATFENASSELPEIAMPFYYQHIMGGDLVQNISDVYEKLGKAVLNCAPYKDFIEIGKDKKLVLLGETAIDSGAEVDVAKLVPMHNLLEFDIYKNANRKINTILQKQGVLKDFLYSLMTLLYGPRSEYEIKYDLYNNSNTQESAGEAHKKYADSLLAMRDYYFFKHKNEEKRITKIHESEYNPSFLGSAIVTQGDDIAFDFDKWYRFYADYFSTGYVWEEEPYAGANLINKFNYQEYFSDFTTGDEFYALSQHALTFGIDFSAIISELTKVFADKMSLVNDVMSKKPCYSEPLMYRIEKRDINDNIIQTIFVPHFIEKTPTLQQFIDGSLTNDVVPKLKKIKFFDTQVKYGKLYKYKVTQIRIVVGSEYRYTFADSKNTDALANALGYGKRFEADTIMDVERVGSPEGRIWFDRNAIVNAETVIEQPEGTQSFSTPFTFYSQEVAVNQDLDYGFKTGALSGESGLHQVDIPYDSGDPLSSAAPLALNKLAIFKASIYPKILIEEVPYYEQEAIISDFPPIPPNVNFDPLVGKGPNILITMENQTGDREEIPVVLQSTDEAVFNIQRTAQGRDEKGPDGSYTIPSLRFKSDDFPKAYQVFKLDTAPFSYEDFVDKLYKVIDVEEKTAFMENLEPNRKHYYVFRTVDIHGNISNPSKVFEVEMVLDSGVFYPLINTYEFNMTDLGAKAKQFKQYLKIEAALLQKLVNKEKSGITDDSSNVDLPILGVLDEAVWNHKKFKFRITSKHTGKMLDLNVKFKTNHTKPDKPIKGC